MEVAAGLFPRPGAGREEEEPLETGAVGRAEEGADRLLAGAVAPPPAAVERAGAVIGRLVSAGCLSLEEEAVFTAHKTNTRQ